MLRGSWIPQDPAAAGEDTEVGGGEAESAGKAAALRQYRPEDIWAVWGLAYELDKRTGRASNCDGLDWKHAEVGN